MNNRPSRITIRDVATLSGVSVATVSRVINDRPDVSAGTRETVLGVMRDHGFVINRNARSLVGKRKDLVALTVPFVHGEYFSRIVAGAAEALYQRDLRFALCPTRHEHDREVSVLQRLMHGTTDGAMLVLPAETNAELMILRRRDYPFVVVDPRVPLHDDIPVVSAAHTSGARMAVEHLISLGHRRIAAITGPSTWVASVDRLAGFRSAMLAAGLAVRPDYVRVGDFQIDSGHDAAQCLLKSSNPPTAIFAFNDNMALGALRAARERGISVPHDLSLIGFDDSMIARVVDPQLTSVRQPLEEMGRVAASILLRLLDEHRMETMRLELSTRLIVRNTTSPPKDEN